MFLTLLLISLITLVFYIYIWFQRNFSYWDRQKGIPSVQGRIFSDSFYNVVSMKTNFYGRIKEIYEDPKFANEAVVGIYGAFKPSLLIRDPQLIKSILIKEFDCFHDRFVKSSPIHDPIGFNMLFFAPYAKWREFRTMFSQLFSTGKVKKIFPFSIEVCERLEQRLNSKGMQYTEDIWNLCTCYMVDVLASFVGVTSDCLNHPEGMFQKAIFGLSKYDLVRAVKYMVIFFIPRLANIIRASVAPKHLESIVKVYFQNALKEREQQAVARNDVIDICLKCLKDFKGTDAERKILVDNLTSQAMVFMMAGVETCMATTTYVLYELAKNESMQKKLRQDILQLHGQHETKEEEFWESLNKLEYLECIINESLRVYPPLPFVERMYCKTPNRSFSLEPYYNYQLPDGMPIYITIPGLNSDPKFWPNPSKYDPDRFLPHNKNPESSLSFIPFGDGPRNCIGGRLGMMMVKSFLAHFLRNHYVRVCDRTNMKIKFDPNSSTLQPAGGLHLEIVRDDIYAKGVGVGRS